MTIISLYHTDTDILAVADGLISNPNSANPSSRVLEKDKKLVMFTPTYKVPRVSMGRFNHFDDYREGDFCLAYAGHYSLVSTIARNFIDEVSRHWVLDRQKKEGWKATIYRMRDPQNHFRGDRYDDSFNFTSDELVPITVNLLTNSLVKKMAAACLDFRNSTMTEPDASFMLFGKERVAYKDTARGQVVAYTGIDVISNQAQFQRFSSLPGAVNFLGDRRVFPGLIADINLASSSPGTTRHRAILQETLKLIQKGTATVGGDCLIAKAGWASALTLEDVGNPYIDTYLAAQK